MPPEKGVTALVVGVTPSPRECLPRFVKAWPDDLANGQYNADPDNPRDAVENIRRAASYQAIDATTEDLRAANSANVDRFTTRPGYASD